MYKLIIPIIHIAIFTCIISCSTKNSFLGKHKNFDRFPKSINLEAEKLVLDAPGILNFMITDTIIIALMNHPDNLLQAYSLKSMKPLGTLLKKGKGPDEFLWVSLPIQVVKDSGDIKLWVLDSQQHFFFLLNVTESIQSKKTIIEKNYDLSQHSFTNDWVHRNDTLWGIQWTMDNLELISCNVDKNTISYHGGPLFEIDTRASQFVHTFSHITEVKPDLSKIVIDMLYLNQLQIISLEKNIDDRFSFSVSKKPVNFEHINDNIAELVSYYKDVRVTDELIFASYSEVPTKAQLEEKMTHIHVFDWEGNPKALLNLPYNTPYFDIDETGYLYCLSSDEELFRYDIKKILNE